MSQIGPQVGPCAFSPITSLIPHSSHHTVVYNFQHFPWQRQKKTEETEEMRSQFLVFFYLTRIRLRQPADFMLVPLLDVSPPIPYYPLPWDHIDL